jgi:hypothetical protein
MQIALDPAQLGILSVDRAGLPLRSPSLFRSG